MWEDVCLCYVSNIERVSLTVGDICIMYIRGSVSSSDLWRRRRMFHLIERRASSLTSNASQYWLSSSYLTTTAKCQIYIAYFGTFHPFYIVSHDIWLSPPLPGPGPPLPECDILLLGSPGRPVSVSESPRSHSGDSSQLSDARQWGDMETWHSEESQPVLRQSSACGEITLRDQEKIPE